MRFSRLPALALLLLAGTSPAAERPEEIDDLICFWDFQPGEGGDLTSRGAARYTFEEMNGPIARVEEGVFGPAALDFEHGQWLRLKHRDCPALDLHGEAEVTVAAWIQRQGDQHWQYIAGMWNELDHHRQYALFTSGHRRAHWRTLERVPAEHQAHGYVSPNGGATPGKPFCFSYATGATTLPEDRWHFIAFTYDGAAIRVYLDGELDASEGYNPFIWDEPIHDAGAEGADFTVAQRAVPKWPDYPRGKTRNSAGFSGILGGLAVFGRALEPAEIRALSAMGSPK